MAPQPLSEICDYYRRARCLTFPLLTMATELDNILNKYVNGEKGVAPALRGATFIVKGKNGMLEDIFSYGWPTPLYSTILNETVRY